MTWRLRACLHLSCRWGSAKRNLGSPATVNLNPAGPAAARATFEDSPAGPAAARVAAARSTTFLNSPAITPGTFAAQVHAF